MTAKVRLSRSGLPHQKWRICLSWPKADGPRADSMATELAAAPPLIMKVLRFNLLMVSSLLSADLAACRNISLGPGLLPVVLTYVPLVGVAIAGGPKRVRPKGGGEAWRRCAGCRADGCPCRPPAGPLAGSMCGRGEGAPDRPPTATARLSSSRVSQKVDTSIGPCVTVRPKTYRVAH